ncbi:hypothetical protein [Streptomyces sp. C8S0]|uniref:hypothetical protein n=1 Tax=Streptomyces sp. C8S0 TaxID=2585716 RepID=UPI00125DAE21|nr:hypothetical protein [Streptomyces sp. C8S0]
MSWISPLAALLGVLLGAVATALADRRRWRREAVARLLELRTTLYAEYLVAMEETEGTSCVCCGPPRSRSGERRPRLQLSPSTLVLRVSGYTSWPRSTWFARLTRSFGAATCVRLRGDCAPR